MLLDASDRGNSQTARISLQRRYCTWNSIKSVWFASLLAQCAELYSQQRVVLHGISNLKIMQSCNTSSDRTTCAVVHNTVLTALHCAAIQNLKDEWIHGKEHEFVLYIPGIFYCLITVLCKFDRVCTALGINDRCILLLACLNIQLPERYLRQTRQPQLPYL